MPVPTALTDTMLATYMHGSLRSVAAAFGYTVPDSYEDAITDALIAYGDAATVEDVPADGIARIRALAKVAAWRMALADATPRTDTTSDGQSTRRSQFWEHIRIGLEAAEREAAAFPATYGGSSMASVTYADRYSGY